MPAGDEQAPPVRASDVERDATVARLRDAAGEGRLTLEELADRAGAAYSAVSRADLDQLLVDLPPAGAALERGERASVPAALGAGRSGECSAETRSRDRCACRGSAASSTSWAGWISICRRRSSRTAS